MRYSGITDRLINLGGEKWAVHNAGRARIAAGEQIIELTIGEPDIPVDPALIDVCEASMRKGRTHYSNGRGEVGLLAALADKYRSRFPEITSQNILCFPGTQTALFAVILALVDEGEGVLVGDPYYATYEGVVRASGGHERHSRLYLAQLRMRSNGRHTKMLHCGMFAFGRNVAAPML